MTSYPRAAVAGFDDPVDFLVEESLDELEAEADYFSLPCVYGRWCGPLCGGGIPINAVDACCQAHDHCYGRRGYFACSCDQDLLRCLAPRRSIRTPDGRAAWTVWSAFRALPCRPGR